MGEYFCSATLVLAVLLFNSLSNDILICLLDQSPIPRFFFQYKINGFSLVSVPGTPSFSICTTENAQCFVYTQIGK